MSTTADKSSASSPARPYRGSTLANLLTLRAIHEWTIRNQPQRAVQQLAEVNAEIARREKELAAPKSES